MALRHTRDAGSIVDGGTSAPSTAEGKATIPTFVRIGFIGVRVPSGIADLGTWAVGAFRLATGGAADDTQIHAHLCYPEFGEVPPAIDALDADVTSIEVSRSHMEFLDDLAAGGYGAMQARVISARSGTRGEWMS